MHGNVNPLAYHIQVSENTAGKFQHVHVQYVLEQPTTYQESIPANKECKRRNRKQMEQVPILRSP
jgi:hypothetical protein